MTELGSNLDPQLLQARWVLGGIEPERFVDIAVSALEQGFDGVALRQLAGLSRPTLSDLGTQPERVFAAMGRKPIDQDEAVALLLASGEPSTSAVISVLRQAFPDFGSRWKKHVAWWGGTPAGSYNHMAEFVQFVVEDLYEKGNLHETRRVFQLLERLLVEADQEARDLIGLGFFETLENVASHRLRQQRIRTTFRRDVQKGLH